MTAWPALPYAAWKDSCATLQLWTQIVRQDQARADAMGQPLLARAALCHVDRADHDSPIPYRRSVVPDRFRFRRSRPVAERQRRACPADRAASDVGRGIPRPGVRGTEGSLGSRSRSTTCRMRLRMRSRSPRTVFITPMTATRRTDSGASCCRAITCCRISAAPFSARSSRCISSGAASILRSLAFPAGRRRAIRVASRTCRTP